MSTRKVIDRKFFSVGGLVILLALLVAGCAGQPQEISMEEGAETSCETLDNAFVALDWVIFGRHTPWYVAIDKGMFLDNCISVTVERGYGSVDTVKRVYRGEANFGFADMSAVIQADANQDFDVKVVYMVYANGAPAVHYLEGRGIETPKDLKGKKIAGGAESSITAMLPGFLRANGLEPSDVELVTVDVTTLNQLLLSGQVDAMLEFPFNNVILNQQGAGQGLSADFFLYAEHGFPLYANGVITTERTIEANPDLVRRFVAAVDEAYRWSFENPEEAVDIMLKYHPEIDREVALGELEIVERLATDPATINEGYGVMSEKKVESSIALIDEFIDLENEIAPARVYTNEFVLGE